MELTWLLIQSNNYYKQYYRLSFYPRNQGKCYCYSFTDTLTILNESFKTASNSNCRCTYLGCLFNSTITRRITIGYLSIQGAKVSLSAFANLNESFKTARNSNFSCTFLGSLFSKINWNNTNCCLVTQEAKASLMIEAVTYNGVFALAPWSLQQ